MRLLQIGGTFVIAMTLTLGLAACEKEKPKGPAEKIGAKLDDAGRDVKAAAKDAKDDIKDAAHDAKEDLKD